MIWLNEILGDVSITRGVVELSNIPTPLQLKEARALMPMIRRLVIDKTGMGITIAETLEQEFWGEVEGVTFTQAVKEDLAVHAKKRMEEAKARIPDKDLIRNSFRSIKKLTTATGQSRFDAEATDQYGNADHWWAFAMAENAANQPTHGLFQVWKEEAEKLQGQRIEQPRTAEEQAKVQADAQMAEARKTNPYARRVFGEQVPGAVFPVRITKPTKMAQTPACPTCGNKLLARYGWCEERCNLCGWFRKME